LATLSFSLYFLSGCKHSNGQTTLENGSEEGRVAIGLNQLEDLHSALSLGYRYRGLQVTDKPWTQKGESPEPIFFLKVSHDLCEPCLVEAIETLKQFKKKRPNKAVILIIDMDTREEKFFLPQFDLDDITAINLKGSGFSELDSLKLDYFGVIEHDQITEILPIHQLIGKSLSLAFLEAHD
jgi:hypothetical protein